MSIQTQYSCPNCGRSISAYSKKGITLLHSNIGIPFLKCAWCESLIKTGHSPFNRMNIFWKSVEILKITLTIIINTLLAGLLIGFMLGWLFNEVFLEINEPINFYIISIVALFAISKSIFSYLTWSKRVTKYVITEGEIISSSAYEHPDW